jgi:CHAT domain-containing protein/Tfp pilus assembly protein PilF
MLRLVRRPRAGWWVLALCLPGLLLCIGTDSARGQPVAPAEELTPAQRRQLEKEARELNQQGTQRYYLGRLDEALKLLEQAVQISRRLYPPERFPDGHPQLAMSLNNLGALLLARGQLGQAEPYYRQALVMRQKLYPAARFPEGHLDLATSLNNMGFLLQTRGELDQAEPFYGKALAMYQKLYPADRYPEGHHALATSLDNLGALLQVRGALGQAEAFHRQALAMFQKLYPADRFPEGHTSLADSLNNLGSLLQVRGELAQAETYLRRALAMYQKLYAKQHFPAGHRKLAASLGNLGVLLHDQGELAQAESYLRRALAMRQQLYPPRDFPGGHPELAASLNTMGSLCKEQGQLAQAETYYRRSLAMCQQLYPGGDPHLAASLNNLGLLLQQRGQLDQAEHFLRKGLAMEQQLFPPERYPDGHLDLAISLSNVGRLVYYRGEPAQAETYLRQALGVYQRLLTTVLAGSAEAQAHNYLAQLPFTRDGYLSVTGRLPGKTEHAYRALWHARGAVAHMLQQRRRTVLLAGDPSSRALADKLLATRQALASLLRPGVQARPDRVRALSEQKENLEKQLADKLPLYKALSERLTRSPAELLPLLPADAVFLDLARYWHIAPNPTRAAEQGERWTLSYVAFVLARGQPIQRVELGEAEPIDQALARWRRSLQTGSASSPAADTLRHLLWRPLEKRFPAGTRTVLLAPDAALTGLPWAALPGRRAGTVLLEEYALATVPDGPFLLDLLRAPARGKTEAGVLLAAGGIDYDGRAEPAPPAAAQGLARAAPKGKGQVPWPALPGTAKELAEVRHLAGKRAVVERQGISAGTGQLLADLPEVRWAHLATHGFFADPSVRSIFQLSAEDYKRSQCGERIGVGARSPLVLCGLVCAGANRPVKDAEKEDGGILTAEAIAGLNLDGLELAVLSACETGLGEVAGGEGVFGLQRAFHIAGARSVVASLWKIDDDATQALMQEFYRNLWERKLPKLEALRRAQLAMLLHYDAKAGQLRAPGAPVPVDPAELAAARQELHTVGRSALPPLYWAGFVLSGDWR